MSTMRDLVSGSDACTPNDGAGPSNALSSLVDNFLGTAKTQEQLHELPSLLPQNGLHRPPPGVGPSVADIAHGRHAHMAIPGLAPPTSAVEADVAAFMEAQQHGGPSEFGKFEEIYRQQQHQMHHPQAGMVDHTRRMEVLHSTFASFLHLGWRPPPLPNMGLSIPEQCRVRDRTTIMARQVFAEQGDEFADAQVSNLLSSLNIDPHALPADAGHRSEAWEGVWAGHHPPEPSAAETAAIDGVSAAGRMRPAGWANDFHQQQQLAGQPPGGWAEEFAGPAGSAGWAQEFEGQEQQPGSSWAEEYKTAQTSEAAAGTSQAVSDADAVRHSRQLAEVMAADSDPKFQNSKFLQFVSKMSRGELVMDGNKVVEKSPEQIGEEWAQEFGSMGANWVQDFADSRLDDENYFDSWVDQFAQEGGPKPSAFGDDWLEEYQNQMAKLNLEDFPEASQNYDYQFNPANPFTGDPNALAKARDLFQTGVLSEAALALEAVVQREPGNVEAWRLLGTVHAENDDDKQAINAMMQALKAGPEDPEVMLSLGVSHTNELDQPHALSRLTQWMLQHPVHSALATAARASSADAAPTLTGTIDMFNAALEATPQDAEIASALGVLYNLSRDYDAAVQAFRHALEIQPSDYSLWNKLGATLANSSRSGEAISAYQRALDLKPNYMRAWTNLGISYANLGDHVESAKYYVQALELNPAAANVWSYLKTSLLCAGRSELMPAVENRDLGRLKASLGIE
eukprot:CAMPEP_0117683932 /NCGR_PEP_ID=MMETSP0804-20121206/20753_1 /TAXON_ID=1074897 /ORGANISM="Tetraselmis astigmatica, Strain CCMP880" /LENGTH=738 /DNA_ID=CAMNT_0005494737 /DNA_START=148 /DNA_END=2364 /DNA_ORIENTATION=+